MWIVLVTLLNLLLLNRKRILFYLLMILGIHCSSSVAVYAHVDVPSSSRVVVGAERMEEYLPLLQGQRIGILTNHTGRIGDAHIVDTLLARGINICRIFAPEHGFRGEADAGERVASTRDQKTGIEVVSLYGTNRKPKPEQMQGIDIMLLDIQDVGLRFYTYLHDGGMCRTGNQIHRVGPSKPQWILCGWTNSRLTIPLVCRNASDSHCSRNDLG